MTSQDKSTIAKLQANLLKIKTTGRAPINLVLYQNWGLVTVIHKTMIDATGNKYQVLDRLQLTAKAEKYLNVTI